VTEGDGRFDFSAPGASIDFVVSRWTGISANAYFTTLGEVLDFGQIVLPAPTIKGRFRFVDENDAEIPIPPNYGLSVNRTVGILEYGAQAHELNQQLPAYLSPGEWNVTAQPVKGYSYGRPLTFNAAPNFVETIRFRKLSTVSARPSLIVSRGEDGELSLRAASESALVLTIEKTSDFKTWSYAGSGALSDAHFDFKFSELAAETNGPVFFRVVADK